MTFNDSWFGAAVNGQLLAPKDVQTSHKGTCQCVVLPSMSVEGVSKREKF